MKTKLILASHARLSELKTLTVDLDYIGLIRTEERYSKRIAIKNLMVVDGHWYTVTTSQIICKLLLIHIEIPY
mgnify:CR=1 FL=1